MSAVSAESAEGAVVEGGAATAAAAGEGRSSLPLRERRLAVASCGNAAVAAAVVAAAADWPIDVCIPAEANPRFVAASHATPHTTHHTPQRTVDTLPRYPPRCTPRCTPHRGATELVLHFYLNE